MIYRLTFIICIIFISCSPEIGNFYYLNNKADIKQRNETFKFVIQDDIKGFLNLEEHYIYKDFRINLGFYYLPTDYLIDNITISVKAINSSDTIELKLNKIETRKENDNSLDRLVSDSFIRLPDSAKLIRLRINYSYRFYNFGFDNTDLDKYRLIDIDLKIRIKQNDKLYDKSEKIEFFRKKRFYIRQSI